MLPNLKIFLHVHMQFITFHFALWPISMFPLCVWPEAADNNADTLTFATARLSWLAAWCHIFFRGWMDSLTTWCFFKTRVPSPLHAETLLLGYSASQEIMWTYPWHLNSLTPLTHTHTLPRRPSFQDRLYFGIPLKVLFKCVPDS